MAVATLPYPNLDFVPLDILTAAEMNQMVANEQYLAQFANGLATGANIDSNAITSDNIDFETFPKLYQHNVSFWHPLNGSILVSPVINSSPTAFNGLRFAQFLATVGGAAGSIPANGTWSGVTGNIVGVYSNDGASVLNYGGSTTVQVNNQTVRDRITEIIFS